MNTLTRWLTALVWVGWGPATVVAVRPALGIDVTVVLAWAAAMAVVGVSLLWIGIAGMRR